jgi:hypothetical protein
MTSAPPSGAAEHNLVVGARDQDAEDDPNHKLDFITYVAAGRGALMAAALIPSWEPAGTGR